MPGSNEPPEDPAAEPPAEPASERVHEPIGVEILEGALGALVHAHDIPTPNGAIACWTYVSEGLLAHGHAELVFTLRRNPDEAVEQAPDEPFRLFTTVYQLAATGRPIGPGAIPDLGEERFLGHHLLFVRAQPLPGVALPEPCLAVVLLADDELRAVRAFGVARVLARMAEASAYYPFPPWADLRRQGLALERTFERSVLARLPRASAPGVRVSASGERVTLSARRSELPAWEDRLAQIPAQAPFALLTGPDPGADGCLVWVPGQKQVEVIAPPGSDAARICGSFLVFVPGQAEVGGKVLEDGFALELTDAAWQAIRRALAAGDELSLEATRDAMSFALTWRDPEDL
ncbi:MAG TPA: hypothetical protein VFT22_12440 [Kofleriaceae bacterium]|nr:hypothetical protein [Kofleriaceae bacterium]